MKKNPSVIFKIPRGNNKYENVTVDAEELRQAINNVNLSKATKEEKIRLELQYKGKAEYIELKLSDIRKIIKTSELCVNFVPNRLSNYLTDITQQQLAHVDKIPIVGRDNEIEKVWFYLSQKKKNNAFLVGPADVGKTTIAFEIARQMSTNECPKEFYEKRLIMFKPEVLLKIKNDSIYELIINSVMHFLVKNKEKIVLFVDKAFYMKTDEYLIFMLYSLLKKYNIPFITTSSEEDFAMYFLADTTISKYVNEVYVEEPELDEIATMIKHHIVRLQKEHGVKISDEIIKFGICTSVLSDSVSANPGNVVNIFEKAFLEAKRKEKDEVDKNCILSCYNSYLKLYNNMSPTEKKKLSYHETGHYVVAIKSKHIDDEKIAFVSILPMMDFLGINWPYKIIGKKLDYTKEYFLDYIAVYLAGRIAEKLIDPRENTGASLDLEGACTIAEQMLTVYGLSENSYSRNRSYVTEDRKIKNYLISENKKEEFDKEIQQIINEGHKIAFEIINENQDLIQVIANKLMQEEILTGEQLTQICEEYNKSK